VSSYSPDGAHNPFSRTKKTETMIESRAMHFASEVEMQFHYFCLDRFIAPTHGLDSAGAMPDCQNNSLEILSG
jgi:hypothetical protein